MSRESRRLTRRERREIGATRGNVRRIIRDIRGDDPEAFQEMSLPELKSEVADRLLDEAPQAMFDGDRDWESFFNGLLDFLSRLLPILLKFIAIF